MKSVMRLKLLPVLALLLTACIPQPAPATSSVPATAMILPSPSTTTAAHACVYRDNGALPDPACTPGAVNPEVTQSNLGATICRSGYSASVRPPVSFTNALKLKQMAEYGVSDRSPRDFEEDHREPLEVGGAPMNPENLWPEDLPNAHTKDRLENYVHAQVCAGRMTLQEGQEIFLGDFAAWQQAHPESH